MADNSKKKSPSVPGHAQATTRSIRKQRSRILGTPSQQGLNERYTEEQQQHVQTEVPPLVSPESSAPEIVENNNADEERMPPPPKVTEEPAGLSGSPRRESMWSIWSRKTSLDTRLPSALSSNSSPQPPSAAASIKSSSSIKSAPVPDLQPPPPPQKATKSPSPLLQPNTEDQTATPSTDQTSIKSKDSTEKKEPPASWMGWRKASQTSLKKAAEEETANTTDQLKSIATDDPSQAKDKSQIVQTSQNIQPKERTSSWSLWNNSTTITQARPSLSNIPLSGTGEAVLFEPTTHAESGTTKKPDKKPRIPNRVVPEFEKSLPYYSASTSIINNFNRFRYTLGFDVEDPKHLYRTHAPPSGIKKVLIIGVHGFFPTKVIRPLIGEPTGTSIKFANEAEKAIWRWAKREKLDISVQKLALEKEGKIFERVEFFYEVMKKWKEDVDSADYIYFAAHSQGCPVSILLLARLIDDEVISLQGKKISLLCMAGINNGPFYGVDQKLAVRAYSAIENDSLMELFQFQNFDSVHSREFLQALRTVIDHNVKITFVGSINDQLVPLYSSTCLHVRHPNIFRATYIDGSSNTPDFVSRAVSIANQLHNVGLSDHGVIKEISNSLAGPLTGGGHSKIYNDPQVYDLAVSFSLYTSDLKYKIPLHCKPYVIETLGTNPYHLPWCMRGLLFEARAHFREADGEIQKLFEEFERWKPETKQLKDMKYRLNGIKSKL